MRIYPLLVAAVLVLTGCGDSKTRITYYFNPEPGFSYTVWAVAPADDGGGDVYVGGQFAYFDGYLVNGIVRLNADGSIDTDFDMGLGFNGAVLAVVPAADGSGDIYVGGVFTSYNGTAVNRIVRLNDDGSIDAGFAIGTGFDNYVYAIAEAEDASGDIYVGGDFSGYNGNGSVRLARLNSDGTFDAGFAVGAGASDTVKEIAVVGSVGGDWIYIGGDFTFYDSAASNYIARIQDDGSYDAGFDVGTGFDARVEALTIAADGSGDIYVGGAFENYAGNATVRIARLNDDGSFDAAFATSTGFNATVYDIAIDSATPAEIFIGGLFTTFDGNDHRRIACLNNTGFVCSGFDSGSGFSYATLALAFANDATGDLFVGGDFFYYQGETHYRFVRLDSDGNAL